MIFGRSYPHKKIEIAEKMSEHSFVSTMTVDSETVLEYAFAYIESELKSKHTITTYLGDFRDTAFKKKTKLRELLTSLYDLVECNRSCMIYALVYMDRLKKKGYHIRHDTVRPIVCVALLLAQKMVLDVSVTTQELSQCLSFVDTALLAAVERDMLKVFDSRLCVDEHEWSMLCAACGNREDRDLLITIQPDIQMAQNYFKTLALYTKYVTFAFTFAFCLHHAMDLLTFFNEFYARVGVYLLVTSLLSSYLLYVLNNARFFVVAVYAVLLSINAFAWMCPEYTADRYNRVEDDFVTPIIIVSSLDLFLFSMNETKHILMTWVSPIVTMILTSRYTHFLNAYLFRCVVLAFALMIKPLIQCHSWSNKMCDISQRLSAVEVQRKENLREKMGSIRDKVSSHEHINEFAYHKVNLDDVDSE